MPWTGDRRPVTVVSGNPSGYDFIDGNRPLDPGGVDHQVIGAGVVDEVNGRPARAAVVDDDLQRTAADGAVHRQAEGPARRRTLFRRPRHTKSTRLVGDPDRAGPVPSQVPSARVTATGWRAGGAGVHASHVVPMKMPRTSATSQREPRGNGIKNVRKNIAPRERTLATITDTLAGAERAAPFPASRLLASQARRRDYRRLRCGPCQFGDSPIRFVRLRLDSPRRAGIAQRRGRLCGPPRSVSLYLSADGSDGGRATVLPARTGLLVHRTRDWPVSLGHVGSLPLRLDGLGERCGIYRRSVPDNGRR